MVAIEGAGNGLDWDSKLTVESKKKTMKKTAHPIHTVKTNNDNTVANTNPSLQKR